MVSKNGLIRWKKKKKITDYPVRLIQRGEIQKEGFPKLQPNVP